MRKILGILGGVVGLGTFVLQKANTASNYLGIFSLPSDLKDALVVLSEIPTLMAWSALLIGLFCAGYLVYDAGHHTLAISYVKRRRLEPIHVIVLGLAIAAIGVIWHMGRVSTGSSVITPPSSSQAGNAPSQTQSGPQLERSIRDFLAKSGKTGNYSPAQAPGNFFIGSDEHGQLLTYWGSSLGPWPTTDDGFTTAQLKFFPFNPPPLPTQKAREGFQSALDQVGTLTQQFSELDRSSLNISGTRPLVRTPEGAKAPLQELLRLQGIFRSLDESFYLGGRFPIFEQYTLSWQRPLKTIFPPDTNQVWSDYNVALQKFIVGVRVMAATENDQNRQAYNDATQVAENYLGEDFRKAAGSFHEWNEVLKRRLERAAPEPLEVIWSDSYAEPAAKR